MKIVKYENPHSSFLSVDKDMEVITNKILQNERLKRLLYYTTKDALDRPNITEDASLELFGKNIKNIPKLQFNKEVLNYINIHFDGFVPNDTNPAFRDNIIVFNIVCHYDQWNLKGFSLRPYKIAAEIDSMFNNQRLTGIGTLEFLGMNQKVYNDEFAGLNMIFLAIHGDEDKKNLPNPIENDNFIEEFNKTWNDN